MVQAILPFEELAPVMLIAPVEEQVLMVEPTEAVGAVPTYKACVATAVVLVHPVFVPVTVNVKVAPLLERSVLPGV